ncbi:SUMF1/EgtB/PvdO family nonheme iron enzyme [Spirosoma fluviale]|uniref:Formylglycine-generating enzyme, required for sulfatase activity, contains SUMF1/FGE domain n=1 Tax=Spirosoma fluviale TaxID=1597977 RepID=A0A286GLK4_9BACT|nr:SUMF1/EgtB/PvdO family nonheme iron enzyme [Spirosoma fluviale]SOD96425.1 Formylglycine-generating enzyme, required for sulfatase activity, contains SUMF1/FGE domain [Spirosoma fluviale]
MKSILYCLLLMMLWQPVLAQDKTLIVQPLPTGPHKRAAVIFANQNYAVDQYDLRKTYNDADDMKAALERLGFTAVVFQKDLDRRNLDTQIKALATRLKGYEVAFVYYSGHGGIYDEQNYMIPVDVPIVEDNADVQTYGISLSSVYKAMEAAGVKTSIVVSDACRNLAIGKGGLTSGMVLPANNPAGTFTMFATRSGKPARENLQGRNSYFTQELLKYIETPNLTLNQIFKATRQSLQTATAKFKEPQVPGCVDELDHEFVLIQSQSTTPDMPPPPAPKNRQYLDLPFAQMVYIPEGTFQMGDTRNEGDKDEKPVHTVTVSGFLMGKYEVTQRQWEAIMSNNPSHFKDCPDCPVEQVSWNDVQEFLEKLNARTGGNYRLPTEAEWEYAAGGGAGTRTRFGNGRDVLDPAEANFDGRETYKKPYSKAGNYRGETIPVGTFRANALGLYDMSGNVWEWCADWYGTYSSSSQSSPVGPTTGLTRVFRGGSWAIFPQSVRVQDRLSITPSYQNYHVGFRVVSRAQ